MTDKPTGKSVYIKDGYQPAASIEKGYQPISSSQTNGQSGGGPSNPPTAGSAEKSDTTD